MNLLHFAHKKEAQAFLAHSPTKQLIASPHTLYENELGLILISGEGIIKSLKAIMTTLASFSIDEVVNLGVAGRLNSNLSLHKIYEVRTVYGQLGEGPEFHSHTLSGAIDLISSLTRIKDQSSRKKLSFFAQMVDRELWGITEGARSFNIPVRSFKLISDSADESFQCEDILAQSEDYSQELLHYYLKQSKTASLEEKAAFPLGFHFTQSLALRYQKLIQQVSLSEEELEKIRNDLTHPKERAKELIKCLEEKSSPFIAQAFQKLEKLLAPINQTGAKTLFDKNLEKESFTLKMEINSQKNIDNLKEELSKLSFLKVKQILNGEDHV